jgi:AbrB family looped-hinge helix DNA binding protein
MRPWEGMSLFLTLSNEILTYGEFILVGGVLIIGGKLEFILKVDGKGRILIPKEIRSILNIGSVVSARVDDGKLIIEPLRDPIDLLTPSVIRGTVDVENEIKELRKAALKGAGTRVRERWQQLRLILFWLWPLEAMNIIARRLRLLKALTP